MFTNLIVRHPYIILIAVSVFCGTCLILPFTLRKIPHFSDPQSGFETRGTVIAQRLTAWANLLEATKPSGHFAVDPRNIMLTTTTSQYPKIRKKNKRKKVKKNFSDSRSEVFAIAKHTNFSDELVQVNQWRKTLIELKNMNKFQDYESVPVNKDGFFCGTPDQRYARVVLSTNDESNLFTYKSMMAVCHIEHQLIQIKHFSSLCDTIKSNHCCHPWSVVNYVALLHNRTSCLGITEQDVNSTLALLQFCSQFYHNLQLTHDCSQNDYCRIPPECSEHDAVYNMLHYLTDITFLPPSMNLSDPDESTLNLKQSIIFLPIACSTKTMEYYHDIEHKKFIHDNVKVVAMELGLKSALFDEYLLRDTWLIGSGGLCVLVCMWIYTESLFLTFMTITAILFSLAISYFMYTLVFELHFFPFMNLLAGIVIIGIGADDVFIFCKIWYMHKMEKNSSIIRLMTKTFHHAVTSMLVTSLTTAAAFYTSLISSITAVCCFSVFAGTAVIANFFLMLTWIPASLVISERWCWTSLLTPHWKAWENRIRMLRVTVDHTWTYLEKFLLLLVLKYRYFWLVILTSVAIASLFVVLRYPGLQLPDSTDFQLFQSSHPFEQYTLFYKQKFWFERLQKVDSSSLSENYKLPLRFVWGILPVDNGYYMDPKSKGTLELDTTFDIADPKSQVWLLNFCRQLRAQPFYLPALGPLLPNCFIESFLSWMQRRCIDPIDKIDRTPCCEEEKFPYERHIFETCIILAMSDLYETPSEYFMPGVAGPKFAKDQFPPTIQALVVEYDSNYSYSMSFNYMDKFYVQVENWTRHQMQNAPAGMRQGWFISELEFYDLQKVLSESTLIAVGAAMGIALLVLLLVTLNVLISLYAILSIVCSIFTTMAILVLLGWKLNVLESITVSTAIGLAVDFSLHYGVSYKLYREDNDRLVSTRQALSNMGGSTAMAALTTGVAGAFMLPSSVLAYIQIGVFLVVVMSVSWVYSTFLFGAMLSIAGPQKGFGQFSYPMLCISCDNKNDQNLHSEHIEPCSSSHTHTRNKTNNVLSDTTLSTTSTVYAIPSSESHELDSLTGKGIVHGLKQQSAGQMTTSHKYVAADQSPSATSDITIIMAEDN